jgi:hypothetical protein
VAFVFHPGRMKRVFARDARERTCELTSSQNADMTCNGVLVPAGRGRNDYISGYRRGLCLPPSFSCEWEMYDDTTTELVCSLPDKSTLNMVKPNQALSRSQMFFVRSCWHSCVRARALDLAGVFEHGRTLHHRS